MDDGKFRGEVSLSADGCCPLVGPVGLPVPQQRTKALAPMSAQPLSTFSRGFQG
jgi:hypothetical protein